MSPGKGRRARSSKRDEGGTRFFCRFCLDPFFPPPLSLAFNARRQPRDLPPLPLLLSLSIPLIDWADRRVDGKGTPIGPFSHSPGGKPGEKNWRGRVGESPREEIIHQPHSRYSHRRVTSHHHLRPPAPPLFLGHFHVLTGRMEPLAN